MFITVFLWLTFFDELPEQLALLGLGTGLIVLTVIVKRWFDGSKKSSDKLYKTHLSEHGGK